MYVTYDGFVISGDGRVVHCGLNLQAPELISERSAVIRIWFTPRCRFHHFHGATRHKFLAALKDLVGSVRTCPALTSLSKPWPKDCCPGTCKSPTLGDLEIVRLVFRWAKPHVFTAPITSRNTGVLENEVDIPSVYSYFEREGALEDEVYDQFIATLEVKIMIDQYKL